MVMGKLPQPEIFSMQTLGVPLSTVVIKAVRLTQKGLPSEIKVEAVTELEASGPFYEL